MICCRPAKDRENDISSKACGGKLESAFSRNPRPISPQDCCAGAVYGTGKDASGGTSAIERHLTPEGGLPLGFAQRRPVWRAAGGPLFWSAANVAVALLYFALGAVVSGFFAA